MGARKNRCSPLAIAALTAEVLTIAPVSSLASGAPELVLRNEALLTATTASGQISIRAGKGIDRTYYWDGCSLAGNLSVRSVRWFGNRGIYDPGASFASLRSYFPWLLECKGVSRTVVQEGQIHFADKESAERWLSRYSRGAATVWSNDGLVVQWEIKNSRSQISVDVWQICIAGQRPTELPKAQDLNIVVSHKSGSLGRYDCESVGLDVYKNTQKAWEGFWAEEDQRESRR